MYTPFAGYQGDISRRGTAEATVTDARAGNCGNVRKGGRQRSQRASAETAGVGLTLITPQCRDAMEMKNNGNATCYSHFQEITVMR